LIEKLDETNASIGELQKAVERVARGAEDRARPGRHRTMP
jgi:hypothetical protein